MQYYETQNTIPRDKSAMTPGGIRMGTPALTTRYTLPCNTIG